MINCPCGYGKKIPKEQKTCNVCGTDLTPLHRLSALPELYYEEGIRLSEEGQLDMAVEKLMTAISLDSNSVDAYIVVGNIYLQKGLYDEATNYIEKALEISPNNEDARAYREKIQRLKGSQAKKERFKKRLAFAGVGSTTFIAGILVLFFFQSDIKTSSTQSPMAYPQPSIEKFEDKEIKVTYIVQKGDSLSWIAKKKYGSALLWPKIYEANKDRIKDPHKLSIGDEIALREVLIQPK